MANRAVNLDDLVFSIRDLKEHGSRNLPVNYRDYYNDGAMDMVTLRENEEAYDKFKIRPRTLRNVCDVDTSTAIFGTRVSFPLGFSPSAMHRLAHPNGEIATSRAAANSGIAMCLSSYSNTSLEDVKAHSQGNPLAMQMCIVKDREITKQLVERAEAAGYKAIFLSVDVPVLGMRLSEMRNKFTLPEDLGFPNLLSNGREEFQNGGNGRTVFDDTLEWDEVIPWLRRHTNMEIWLKGITSPSDVRLAIEHGVDGVVISNHGGRQLDGTVATVDALADIVPMLDEYYASHAALKNQKKRIRIIVDGGIRRGSDIFKALALGAEHTMVGRIPIWGLAYKGQAGVELAVQILLREFKLTMALAGCRKVSDITRDHLSVLDSKGLLCKL